jgi:molybdopterin-guanine dinucleotide biosynthesis protein A
MSHPLHGLILAGGKSQRMKRNKSTLKYHQGLTQIDYIEQLIQPFVQTVFISTQKKEQKASHFKGHHLILDQFSISSPLNGILSAMAQYPRSSWLVVAVDMPFITPKAIELLLQHRDQHCIATAFISPIKGGADPLFSIWEGMMYSKIIQYLETIDSIQDEVPIKKACPRGIFNHFHGHLIKTEPPKNTLANINTPQEYQKAVKILQKSIHLS